MPQRAAGKVRPSENVFPAGVMFSDGLIGMVRHQWSMMATRLPTVM